MLLFSTTLHISLISLHVTCSISKSGKYYAEGIFKRYKNHKKGNNEDFEEPLKGAATLLY